VKDEVYRVAKRHALPVLVVANSGMEVPQGGAVELVRVSDALDAVDDWIVEHLERGDVVVTTDVPLAARCVAREAIVLHPAGREFSESDVGSALAMRDLLKALRESGRKTRGPAPFTERDRSRFLQALDAAIHRSRRASAATPRPAPKGEPERRP
jgi:uncharacterized protein YaiI (UPF0178 family)